MKILVDTNILISALVFKGKIRNLLIELLAGNEEIFVSSYIDQEFQEKLKEKWGNVAEEVYALYRELGFNFLESTNRNLAQMRDKKDIPILSDAIFHDIDIILTGDKDFLSLNLEKPKIFSPTMMLEYIKAD